MSAPTEKPAAPDMRALLEEVLDYFEDRADTRDTNDGPAPNEEMLWADRIRRELGHG